MYDLKGKVALVNGAGGDHGICRAIAMRLAKEDADIVVMDRLSEAWQGMAETN